MMTPGARAHAHMRRQLGALTVSTASLIVVLFIAGPWIALTLLVVLTAWVLASWTGSWFGPLVANAEDSARYDAWDLELDRAEALERECVRLTAGWR